MKNYPIRGSAKEGKYIARKLFRLLDKHGAIETRYSKLSRNIQKKIYEEYKEDFGNK